MTSRPGTQVRVGIRASSIDATAAHIENTGVGKDVATMPTLDPGAVRILTPVAHGDAVLTDALQHAVRRDLERLLAVLAAPVTAVRRAALVEHTQFLLDQLQEHHHVLDEISWPGVLAIRPDLTDVANRVAVAHAELTEPLRRTRESALGWRGDPRRRLEVL